MADEEIFTHSGDMAGYREGTAEVDRGHDEPFYPILDPSELDLKDLRDELPEETRNLLKPHERVVHIHHHEIKRPAYALTADRVLTKASGARFPSEIGFKGPTVASVNPLEEKQEESRYERQHGRDDLQAAMDVANVYPKLLETTLVSLAETQGVTKEEYVENKPFGQEMPGSIILINRDEHDPIGRKFTRLKKWAFPYYGSVDAPASFINGSAIAQARDIHFLTGTLYRGKDGVTHTMMTAFARSIEWLLQKTEENPEGLLEYKNPIQNGGLMNQGWRDSAGALVHTDGSWASTEYGIAAVEVQGLAYDAFRNGERIYRDLLGNEAMANELSSRAENLQRQVLDKFYNGKFIASGTDRDDQGNLRRLDVRTSAMGRLLNTGILKGDDPRLEEVVQQIILTLCQPDMLTPWGLRTLASTEEAYRSPGYHTGSIWIFDTNEIAAGAANHGYFGIDRLFGAGPTNIVKATGLFPEFIAGNSHEEPVFPERDTYVWNGEHNEIYLFEQVPPIAQTWSATTEIAKRHRYAHTPERATDPRKQEFEDKVLTKAT